ncbi:tetratricopeptide repeat protein [Polynucleobacter sinensis]|uniref:tetratricopeptide repeat protein n=1 Tax=Polynucleobacter sinensis TaxID=1743157 RepID=UPI0007803F09|nr:tetratricopeptide repeat protein [Polynucleobacter sinensis]
MLKSLLGQASLSLKNGNAKEATAILQKAIYLHPSSYEPHYKLGMLYARAGQLDFAIESLQKAIAINDKNSEVYYNLGLILSMDEQYEAALHAYEKALDLAPSDIEAQINMAGVLNNLGRYQESLDVSQNVISRNSSYAQAWFNQASSQKQLYLLEDALRSYEGCLQLSPAYAEAWAAKGILLDAMNRPKEAILAFNQALVIRPNFYEAWKNRADTFYSALALDSAIEDYRRAISLSPNFIDAWSSLGNALQDQGNYLESIKAFDKVLQLNAHHDFALGSHAFLKRNVCDWNDVKTEMDKIVQAVNGDQLVIHPFYLLAMSDDEAKVLDVARTWVGAKHVLKDGLPEISSRTKRSRIRLGYFSADFRLHAVAHLIVGLLESHDKSQFEVFGFAFGPNAQDGMNVRISSAFDRFIDIREMSDKDVALLARELEIDIAVDLTGLTQHNRPEIFMHRAAPIQINYLGYPGSVGYKEMDYLMADKVVIPPEHRQNYLEKIVYLPDTYQANDSKREIANRAFARQDFGLPHKGFVFCCFNNLYKITPTSFDSWMRILGRVEGSVLWLLDGNPTAVNNLKKEAMKRGINSSRLVFAPRAELAEHLARHCLADLFIDSLPYGAHTTASDALWAGLPVLTCLGKTFVGRVAASLLHAMSMPELAAQNIEDFENMAVELALNPEQLQLLKDKLHKNRLTTPLFDTKLFAQNIERAYCKMMERHLLGLPPDHLDIESANR